MSYDSIKDIFKTVLEFEESAADIYRQIVKETNNKEIKDLLREIIKDEVRHAENAKKIIRILEE